MILRFKKSIISLLATFYCVTTTGFAVSAGAEAIPDDNDDEISLQASSTAPVNDERIAAYFSVDPSSGQEMRTCTASNLSSNLWLTARHCAPKTGDYLKQTDGEEAAVEQVHLYSEADDLALIEVGPGINASSFTLPDSVPAQGDALTFIGYGETHDFASIADLEVINFIDSYPPELGIPYNDLLVVKSTTPSRTCQGDSGGPAYDDNTIYAVHTAAGINVNCNHGEGALSWVTLLTPDRIEWISSFISAETPVNDSDQEVISNPSSRDDSSAGSSSSSSSTLLPDVSHLS